MALTNRVDPEYNFENILRDFDIFIISKDSKHLERTNVLDLLQDKFKALSVLYSFGTDSYALFVKGSVTLSELREAYGEIYDDIRIIQVSLSDLYDEKFCKEKLYYKKRMLAQLLLNSIRSPKNAKFAYNNLTGRLFYRTSDSIERWGPETKIERIKLLQIVLDNGMYINVDEKSFIPCKDPDKERKRKYVLDKKTKNFRRMLSSDKDQEIFVEGNYKKKGKRIKYLNVKNFTSFSKCRLGVLYQFLEDVERHLGDYMHLRLLSRDNIQIFEETHKLKPDATKKRIGELLIIKGVNIVDLIQSPESMKATTLIENCLNNEYGVSVSYGNINKAKYNIRIIHSEEYYEDKNMSDPHDDDLGNAIVQHITVDTLKTIMQKNKLEDQTKLASTICAKSVQELILKNDVRENYISIYDWARLSYQKNWTFVLRERIRDNSSERENSDNGQKEPKYEYYCVQIDAEGYMHFSRFGNEHPTLYPVFNDLAFQLKSYGSIEGFAFSNEDNVHAIIKGKEKTMPDISKIWNGLKDTNDKTLVSRDVLIRAIEAVTEMYPEQFCDYCPAVIKNLKDHAPFITKKQLRPIIQIRTKLGKRMNRALCEHFGIWIYSEVRDRYFEEVYRLGDIANIQFFYETNDYNKSFFNYFVGSKRSGIDRSIANASIVRKVYSMDSDNEFQELLPLMSIEFVRNGMYTVLPFPFKYLREYQLMLKAKEK